MEVGLFPGLIAVGLGSRGCGILKLWAGAEMDEECILPPSDVIGIEDDLKIGGWCVDAAGKGVGRCAGTAEWGDVDVEGVLSLGIPLAWPWMGCM